MMDNSKVTDLIIKFKNGDRSVFNDIYAETYAFIYRICIGVTRDWKVSERLTQDIFFSIADELRYLKDPSEYEYWMMMIALNKCLDHCANRRQEGPAQEEPSLNVTEDWTSLDYLSDDHIRDPERYGKILSIIRSMDERLYLTIYLYYHFGFEYDDIASSMECSVETVGRRIIAAKNIFKECLTADIAARRAVFAEATTPFLSRFFDAQENNINPQLKPFAGAKLFEARRAVPQVQQAVPQPVQAYAAAVPASQAEVDVPAKESKGFFGSVPGKIISVTFMVLGIAGFGITGFYWYKDHIKNNRTDSSVTREDDTEQSSATSGTPAPDAVRIDLNQYLKYQVTGYNKYAVMNYSVDYDAVISSNGSVTGMTADQLRTAVTGSWNKTTGLANGDELVFTWADTGVSDFEQKNNVDLVYEPVTYTVNGLGDASNIKLFDYVTVSFDGNNGDGRATLEVSNSIPVSGVTFDLSESSGLKNDQKVVVTARGTGKDLSEILIDQGYYSKTNEKTYIVSGLKLEGAWKARYIEIANAYKDKHGKSANFALACITDDDIPELFCWYNTKASSVKTRHEAYFEIYSVSGGDVIKIGSPSFEFDTDSKSEVLCNGNLYYIPYSNAIYLGTRNKEDSGMIIDAYWLITGGGTTVESKILAHSSYDATKYGSLSEATAAGAVNPDFDKNDYTYSFSTDGKGNFTVMSSGDVSYYETLGSMSFDTPFDALNLSELKALLN